MKRSATTRSGMLLLIFAAGMTAVGTFADDAAPPRRVYVPIEDLDVVLERDPRGVLLHKAEFDKLSAQAEAAAKARPAAPAVPIAWANAKYQATIHEHQLLLSVRAELEQFVAEWQKLTLPLTRCAVERARIDGAPALIGRGDNGELILFSSGAGRHVVELDLSTDFSAIGADRAAAFGLLPAPSGIFSVTAPAGMRLQVGGAQPPRPVPIDQPAEYRLAIGGRESLELLLTDRVSNQSADVLVFATTGYGLHVLPGEVSWNALTTWQVFGKPIDQLSFSTPHALEIIDVESSGLESWELSDDADRPGFTRATLKYRQPVSGERQITVRGVLTTQPDVPWTVPALTLANITSHVGQVVVQSPAGVRLQPLEATGVRRATLEQRAASDMPTDMAQFAAVEQLRFDFWQPDFTLRFLTHPRERDVQTAVAAVLDVNATGLDLEAAVSIRTRFAPLFDIDLELPAEWTLLSVMRGDESLAWQTVSQTAGKHRWRINLPAPLAVDQLMTLRLSVRREVENWPIEQEPIRIGLPELALPQSNLYEGTLVVRGDEEFDLSAIDVSGLDSVPLQADYERLRFQAQDTRYTGTLQISRKPSRIAVETLSFTRLDPETLQAFLQAAVEVQGGGVRSLQIALPEWAGTALRFKSPGGPRIVDQTAAEPQNGERVWTIQFDRRLRGRCLLTVDLENSRGAAEAWTVPEWKFRNAERQNGYLAIEASGEQRIALTAKSAEGADLPEIDPLDLPATGYAPKERIIAVYRTVSPGAVVSLAEQRFAKEGVPTGICRLLAMESVAGPTGELQHRAEFTLQIVGVQSLSLRLPDGARPWSTQVDGQPVEIREHRGAYLVPLPETESVESERKLELFYQTTSADWPKAGRLEQTSPQLGVVTGAGETQSVPVLEQQWKLHYGGDTLLVGSDGVLEPTTPLDPSSWLARWQSSFRQPTWPQLGQSLLIALAVVLAAMIPMLFVRRYGSSRTLVRACLLLALLGGFAILESVDRTQRLGGPAPVANPEGVNRTIQQPATEAMPSTAGMGEVELAQQDATEGALSEDRKSNFGLEVQAPLEKPKAPPPEDQPQDPRDDAAQMAKENAPAKSEGGKSGMTKQAGGLLSLSLQLSPPAGGREKVFRYVGHNAGDAGRTLAVTSQSRRAALSLKIFFIALGVLAAWLRRGWPRSTKWLAVLSGLLLPWGLIGLTPPSWSVVWDGVFVASLAAGVVWVADALCAWCERKCPWGCGMKCAAASGICFALIGGECVAEEKSATATEAGRKTTMVVVPYEGGTDPATATRVLLPQAEFLKLWKAAHPEDTGVAPVEGGVLEALYTAKVAGENGSEDRAVNVSARYVIQSHVDGQWQVMLPIGTVAIQSAKLNDEPATIAPKDQGYLLVVPKAGSHVLDVEFAVPAKVTGAAGQFTLPLRPVPAGKLSFVAPERNSSVRVNGSSTAFRQTTTDDMTTIELPIDGAKELTVAWQPLQAKGAGAAVVHVESSLTTAIADNGVTLHVGLNYRVRQGTIQDVSLEFPAALKLQSLAGADLGGWEMQETPAGRKLRILLRRPVSDQTQAAVKLFLDQKIGAEPVALELPAIVPTDVTHEIGAVAISAADQFQVTAGTVSGAAQIDAGDYRASAAAAAIAEMPRLAYRFSRRPFQVTVQVSRQVSRGQVVGQHGVTVMRRKLQSTSRFHYQLTGAPRSTLTFVLPKDFLPLDVKATALSDWYLDRRGDSPLLVVQLGRTMLGTVEAVITGSRLHDPNAPTAEIVLPQPQEVTRLESTLAIWTDESYRASVQAAEGWRAVDAGTTGPDLQRLRAQQPIRFAFQSSAVELKPVTLQLSRGEPQLRADGLTTTTVTEFTVVHALALQWQIQGAAVESLSLTTPKSLSRRLDFQGAEIREVTEAEAENDRVRWTIWFRGPVTGKYFATALAALPPASSEVAAPGVICEQTAPGGQPAAIENQRQYVLLINGSTSQLTRMEGDVAETIQREDLPIVVEPALVDQGTELLRLKQAGVAPKWAVKTLAQTAAIPASVNLADLTTVVARDGSYRTEAIYTIKNRRRQFLALRLPEGVSLLSAMLGDQPARCVTATVAGKPAHLIALPKTSEADLSFEVKVVLSGVVSKPLPARNGWRAEDIDIPAPQVISQAEEEAFGIPVARTRWTVYLAEDLDASGARDAERNNLTFLPEGAGDALSVSAVLQEFNELLDVMSMSSSVRNRKLAESNLKQLESALLRSDGYSYSGNSPESEELAEQQRKALDRFEQLQSRGRAGRDLGRRAQPGEAALPALNFSGQSEVLAYTIQQNNITLNNNSGNGIVVNEAADESFQLQLQDQAVPERESSEKSAPQQRQSDFQARGESQRQNTMNLEGLNAEIGKKKLDNAPKDSKALGVLGKSRLKQRGVRARPADGEQEELRDADSDDAMALNGDDAKFGDDWADVQRRGTLGGGMGGMGGGAPGMGGMALGGMGGAEAAGGERAGWPSVGGLSLPVELPRAGQKLVFTKIGGDPKLSLSVRPKGALRFGASVLWVAATVIGAVLLFKALRGPEAQRHVTQLGACGLAVLGLVGWCLLPGAASIFALGALAVGAMGVVWKAEVGRAKAEG